MVKNMTRITTNKIIKSGEGVGGVNTTIRQIFERYSEDTISDELLKKVFEPVLKMIKEGKFTDKKTASGLYRIHLLHHFRQYFHRFR